MNGGSDVLKSNRLSPKVVSNKRTSGYYADGNNLYLQISKTGTKSWIFRFTLNGKEREMGLGPLHTVALADARAAAADARKLLLQSIDPILARDAAKTEQALRRARAMTFADCAKAYIEAHRKGWKNAKHAAQWESTLETYADAIIGKLPVQDVDTALVMKVLEPVWHVKPETASRVRGRIESILNWATTRGYRTGENPARWRGHLDNLLPALKKRLRTKHHPALPFADMGAFVMSLRAQEGVAARALEFLILTAARTGEVIGAEWTEIDLSAKVWTIPASRMKAGNEHRVPLSPRALAILEAMDGEQTGFVFPGQKEDAPLSNMAMLALLERMGRDDLTVHGFRSSFRDWTAERTSYPREVCEMALAHTVDNAVEAAYRRGDLFEKRRRLMTDWMKHCDVIEKKSAKVIPLGRRA